MNYSDIITVQVESVTQDAFGEEVRTYTDNFTIGANIRQASGTISVSAAKETNSVIMFFDVPRTDNTYNIRNEWRLATVDGEVWEIYNVDKYSFRDDNYIRITARSRR